MERIHKYLRALKHVVVVVLTVTILIAAIHFPYDVDTPLTQQEVEAARKYYTEAYQKPATETEVKSEYETTYIRVAEEAAKDARIEEQVSDFVRRFNLSDRPVLEIGSGRGYLHDVAQNYTGLDISPVWRASTTRNLFSARPRRCPFRTTALTESGRFGCSSTYLILSRRFMKLDVSHETMEYFSYSRRGIVRLGLPRVTKSDPIPTSA
jgi:hypothetical protein